MSTVQLTAPPGYGPVVPFDKSRHAGLGLRADRGFGWCAQLNAVMVSVAEFPRAALDYPIAFARDPRGGQRLPVAVLGLAEKQNLFVDGAGHWRRSTYIPAFFRRHPFCIAELPAQGGQPARQLVCVQEDGLVGGAKPLFDASGRPSEEWAAIEKLLEAAEAARRQTLAFSQRLESLEAFTAFDAVAVPRGGDMKRLGGLFRVDEEKLGKLPGGDLKELLASGAMRAVHAHLISLENFARLLDLSQETHGR